MRSIMVAGLWFVTSLTALAAESPGKEVAANGFAAQRAAIVAGFDEGGRYAEIGAEERMQVLAALDRMQALLDPSTPVDRLSSGNKVALYNDQEIVNTILTQAQEASREVCEHHRTVNSRLKKSECHTVAEWERRREAGRELAERARGTAGLGPGM